MADQGVSSLSNFALGVVVARTLDSAGFGAFSLAYVTYAFVLSATRGLATDPLLVRFSGPPSSRWRSAVAASTATAAAVGVVAGLGCILVGLLLPPALRDGFVALGIGLPFLMLQDSWRFVFFSVGRPAKALVNDLVWGVLLLGVLVALAATGRASVFACVLAFGATAGLAAAFGFLQGRITPRPGRVRSWIVDHKDLGTRYLVENLSISGARQIRMVALGAFASLAAVGDTRAAEILMGPFLVILMGASQVAVPEASHVLKRNPWRLTRFTTGLGLALAVSAGVWAAAMLLLLPTGLGEFVIGPIWSSAHALLVPVAIGVSVAGFQIADAAGVRALGAARRSLSAQLVNAGLYLVGGSAGAIVDGARGSCWGVAIATMLGAFVWRRQLRRAVTEFATAEPSRTTAADPTPDAKREDHVVSTSAGTPRAGRPPALSIGLPVYNGERFLAEALDSLLAQTFTDFELVISDNASDDRTEEICRAYADRDPRIRYIRQTVNIGVDPNHRFVFEQTRGRYFKWASDDDLYSPEFVRRCVDALEAHPEAVLAHSADATIDETGAVVEPLSYLVDTENPRPPARFMSVLRVSGGNDDYGVIRSEAIRRVAPYGSGSYGSDRVFVAGLSLQGPFHHVPEVLYFRREHPGRASRITSKKDRAAVLDPSIAARTWNPAIRLHLEYVVGFVAAVGRAPLSAADRLRCWGHVAGWVLDRARPGGRDDGAATLSSA